MPWQRSLRLLVGECIRLLARVKSWGWSSLRRLDEDGTEKESYLTAITSTYGGRNDARTFRVPGAS